MSLFDDFFAEHVTDIDVEYLRIQNEAEQGIQTTKSGKHIAVSDMTDEHIINTRKMLKRLNDNDLSLPWIEWFETELHYRGVEE